MTKTKFREIVNKKGYTFKDLMALWDVSSRQLTRWSASKNPKYVHMANGLPDKGKPDEEKGQNDE
ncbi:hypothetical protein [Vibrio cholerae]|uniref:hypothetical protein n=1 Tax=Vibrio cholerae TaxID=666 RepID=UPI00115B8FC3|nr:hypothetical protein [Vibrio cholerae]MBS3661139.1 hypothetical protein [Vibrio cholerae]MVB87107.1 hypothetical protein [Vibrio cholerae]MVC24494.1 hypothetical protein [Vibrio cholerae]MVC65265.1 hypothetical protein [Vibrio cholerae]MVC87362.1 hypothetical protein [Vibrio cholerae]